MAKPRKGGLGKGLGALISTTQQPGTAQRLSPGAEADGARLIELDPRIIKPNPQQPRQNFDEESLRRAYEQPTGSLTDFSRAALGLFKFPTREERITSAFNAWVAQHSRDVNPEKAKMLRLLQQRVLQGEKIEMSLFSQPPFSMWGGRVRMEQLFGKDGLARVVDELNTLLAA